jgi:hypothetical protein
VPKGSKCNESYTRQRVGHIHIIYQTLSKINYGSIIYNSASDAEKNRLLQNKALKIVTGAFPSTNTEKLHVETNTLKLDLQKKVH